MGLFDYVNQGGSIMYLLLFVNIIGVAILIWKVAIILQARKQVDQIASDIFHRFKSKQSGGHESLIITLLKDEVSARVHQLETGLNSIKIIATTAPLLGLLGTVIGIFSSFKVISQQGLSDPSLFAGGISLALITTVGGLIVAIPHLIGHNYLVGLLDDLELNLERKAKSFLLEE